MRTELFAQAAQVGPTPPADDSAHGGELCGVFVVLLAAGLLAASCRRTVRKPAVVAVAVAAAADGRRRERDERLAELVAASRDIDNPLDPVAVVAQLQAIQDEYEKTAGAKQ